MRPNIATEYPDRPPPGIAVAIAGYAVGSYFRFGTGMLARSRGDRRQAAVHKQP